MIEIGQILSIINEKALFFQGKEKYYINHSLSIGNKEVGKMFTFILVEKFRATGILYNPDGEYKLIGFRFYNGILFPFFKNKKGDIIAISLWQIDFNNYIIGDFYDLNLIKYYIGVNSVDYLPSNKTSNNVKVTLLNKFGHGYLALYNENSIFIKNDINLDNYLGKPIYIDLYPSFWASRGILGEEYPNVLNSNAQFYLTNNENRISTVIINNNLHIILSGYILNSNNIGKTLNIDYGIVNFLEPLNLTPTLNNSGYELITINKSLYNGNNSVYVFRNSQNFKEIIYVKTLFNIDLNNRLGSFFDLKVDPFYQLLSFSPSNEIKDSSYLLKEIFYSKSNLCSFIKDNNKIYVNIKGFSFNPSQIGEYFELSIFPFIIADILDVN